MNLTVKSDYRRRRAQLRVLPQRDEQTTTTRTSLVDRQLLISRVASMFLLIPALPVIGLLMALVRLTSSGPAIYRQRRVGYQGREFVMLKLRTMRENAEADSGPVWAKENDDRATFLGKFLRRVHLDELPQLFNVLRGEMCLVGPRPERPEIVSSLCQQVPGYLDRLAVPPGIAGLAQLRQGADVDIESVMGKQSFDLAYIRCLPTTGWLDLRILMATALLVVGSSRETAARLFGLDRLEPIAIADTPVHTVPSQAHALGRRAA